MLRHDFRFGSVIVLLILFHLMPIVPRIEGEVVPLGLKGTRGTIIVNASGGGDYTCVQWAIDNASDGDTVMVEAGVYYEKIIVNKSISLVGQGIDKTIINSSNPGTMILIKSDWVNLTGFSIEYNKPSISGSTGIFLYNVNNVTVKNNECYYYDDHSTPKPTGIGISGSNNNILSNIINGNHQNGIEVRDSNNVVSGNSCLNNSNGIALYGSFNRIMENDCKYNSVGMRFLDSHGNEIYINNLSDNMYGILSKDLERNTIRNNNCSFNQFGIYLYSHSDYNNITSNLCYSNSEHGIFLSYAESNYIRNNICQNNIDGIHFNGVDNHHIARNIVVSNTCNINEESGISLTYSDHNNIMENTCEYNGEHGIYLDSSTGNSLTSNNCSNNGDNGIILERECDLNEVEGNILRTNTEQGICLSSESTRNYIHQNLFIDNKNGMKQARDDGIDNSWYDSQKGNYWSHWTEPDSDVNGIVDNPLEISGNAKAVDELPMTNPECIPIPIADAGVDLRIFEGRRVTLDCMSSEGYSFISNCTWAFIYGNEEIILYGHWHEFFFHIPGIFEINLTVANKFGQRTSDTKTITVLDITTPIANAGMDVMVSLGRIHRFNGSNSSDNVEIVSYTWKLFVDGKMMTLHGAPPSYLFDKIGVYAVYLTVEDTHGNEDVDIVNITVIDTTPPNADAGKDIIIHPSETVEFLSHQNSSDNVGIVNWTWTFHYNGSEKKLFHSVIMSSLPFFTFDIIGTYIVVLNVTDETGNWALDTLLVTVTSEQEIPWVFAGNDLIVDINTPVRFKGSCYYDNLNITNYNWIFDYNGTTIYLYGLHSIFHFEIPGNYSVKFRVIDDKGRILTDDMNVIVMNNTMIPADDDVSDDDSDDVLEDDDEDNDENDDEKTGSEWRGIWKWFGLCFLSMAIPILFALLFFLWKRHFTCRGPSNSNEKGNNRNDSGDKDNK